MLEDKWLVQILVKDSDGDWTIGTGYPIGNGVVLTANHVVSFTKRNAIPQFTLVWHKQEYLETPFTIVFQDEQLDLAIAAALLWETGQGEAKYHGGELPLL